MLLSCERSHDTGWELPNVTSPFRLLQCIENHLCQWSVLGRSSDADRVFDIIKGPDLQLWNHTLTNMYIAQSWAHRSPTLHCVKEGMHKPHDNCVTHPPLHTALTMKKHFFPWFPAVPSCPQTLPGILLWLGKASPLKEPIFLVYFHVGFYFGTLLRHCCLAKFRKQELYRFWKTVIYHNLTCIIIVSVVGSVDLHGCFISESNVFFYCIGLHSKGTIVMSTTTVSTQCASESHATPANSAYNSLLFDLCRFILYERVW